MLAWSAGSIAAKGGSPTPPKPVTGVPFGLLDGHVLVGIAGFVLLIGAAYAVYRGISRAFLRELDLASAGPRQAWLVTRLGQLGWVALGLVAFGVYCFFDARYRKA